jgi:IS1 family transposase
MNKLSTAERIQIVSALVEGNSLRSTSRMCDVSINTVTKLLVDLGTACLKYEDQTLRNLKVRRVQADEIWAFIGAKAKNVPASKVGAWGDVWTWTALDADTKLIVSWMVGGRDAETGHAFMRDVADRIKGRCQLTTDGHRVYLTAVEDAFGVDVDFATLTKIYARQGDGRYSPADYVGAKSEVITGEPDPRHISTSYVERQNLTMRMGMRRFTRLTNGFSKKAENHAHACALHFLHYNFCRVHKTLRVTPAMEAGIASHVWTLGDIVALLD